MDALTDGIGSFFSGWFGGKDSKDGETEEKTALSTFTTERFKLIETNIQEGSLGHKLKKAQVVLLLEDNNSPYVQEFVKKEFTKKSAFITDLQRIRNDLHRKCGDLNRYSSNVVYFDASSPKKAHDVGSRGLETIITKTILPTIVNTIYAQTEAEIRYLDERVQGLSLPEAQIRELDERLQPFVAPNLLQGSISKHTQEQRLEYLKSLLAFLTAVHKEMQLEAPEIEVQEIIYQTKKLYEETDKALKTFSKVFIVTDECNGRFVRSNSEAIAAVQSLYQQFKKKNISFVTLKARHHGAISQSERENRSLNDPTRAEQKVRRRAAKIDQATAEFRNKFELNFPKTWSVLNQAQYLEKTVLAIKPLFRVAALEFANQQVNSWELPEQ